MPPVENDEKKLEKLIEMDKYIPFLDFMIDRIYKRKSTSTQLDPQLGKFRNFRTMIVERNCRTSFAEVDKIEDIIQKVMFKLNYKLKENEERNVASSVAKHTLHYSQTNKTDAMAGANKTHQPLLLEKDPDGFDLMDTAVLQETNPVITMGAKDVLEISRKKLQKLIQGPLVQQRPLQMSPLPPLTIPTGIEDHNLTANLLSLNISPRSTGIAAVKQKTHKVYRKLSTEELSHKQSKQPHCKSGLGSLRYHKHLYGEELFKPDAILPLSTDNKKAESKTTHSTAASYLKTSVMNAISDSARDKRGSKYIDSDLEEELKALISENMSALPNVAQLDPGRLRELLEENSIIDRSSSNGSPLSISSLESVDLGWTGTEKTETKNVTVVKKAEVNWCDNDESVKCGNKSADHESLWKCLDNASKLKGSDDANTIKGFHEANKLKSSVDANMFKVPDNGNKIKGSEDAYKIKSSVDANMFKVPDNGNNIKGSEDTNKIKSSDEANKIKVDNGSKIKGSEDAYKIKSSVDANKIKVDNGSKIKGSEDTNKIKGSDEANKIKVDNGSKIKGSEDTNKIKGSDEANKIKGSDNGSKIKCSEDTNKIKSSDEANKIKGSDNGSKIKCSEDTNKIKGSDEANKIKVDNGSKIKCTEDTNKIKSSDEANKIKVDNGSKIKGSEDTNKIKGSDEANKIKGSDNGSKIKCSEDTNKIKSSVNANKIKGSDNGSKMKGSEDVSKIKSSDDENKNKDANKFGNEPNQNLKSISGTNGNAKDKIETAINKDDCKRKSSSTDANILNETQKAEGRREDGEVVMVLMKGEETDGKAKPIIPPRVLELKGKDDKNMNVPDTETDEDFAFKLIEDVPITKTAKAEKKKGLLELPMPDVSTEIPFLTDGTPPCPVDEDLRFSNKPMMTVVQPVKYGKAITTEIRAIPTTHMTHPQHTMSMPMPHPMLNTIYVPPPRHVSPSGRTDPRLLPSCRIPGINDTESRPERHSNYYDSYSNTYRGDRHDTRFRSEFSSYHSRNYRYSQSSGPKSYAEHRQMKQQMKDVHSDVASSPPSSGANDYQAAPPPRRDSQTSTVIPNVTTNSRLLVIDPALPNRNVGPKAESVACVKPSQDSHRTAEEKRKGYPNDSRLRYESRTHEDKHSVKRGGESYNKKKEKLISPLERLYAGGREPKTGRGYGLQAFRIPKKIPIETKSAPAENLNRVKDPRLNRSTPPRIERTAVKSSTECAASKELKLADDQCRSSDNVVTDDQQLTARVSTLDGCTAKVELRKNVAVVNPVVICKEIPLEEQPNKIETRPPPSETEAATSTKEEVTLEMVKQLLLGYQAKDGNDIFEKLSSKLKLEKLKKISRIINSESDNDSSSSDNSEDRKKKKKNGKSDLSKRKKRRKRRTGVLLSSSSSSSDEGNKFPITEKEQVESSEGNKFPIMEGEQVETSKEVCRVDSSILENITPVTSGNNEQDSTSGISADKSRDDKTELKCHDAKEENPVENQNNANQEMEKEKLSGKKEITPVEEANTNNQECKTLNINFDDIKEQISKKLKGRDSGNEDSENKIVEKRKRGRPKKQHIQKKSTTKQLLIAKVLESGGESVGGVEETAIENRQKMKHDIRKSELDKLYDDISSMFVSTKTNTARTCSRLRERVNQTESKTFKRVQSRNASRDNSDDGRNQQSRSSSMDTNASRDRSRSRQEDVDIGPDKEMQDLFPVVVVKRLDVDKARARLSRPRGRNVAKRGGRRACRHRPDAVTNPLLEQYLQAHIEQTNTSYYLCLRRNPCRKLMVADVSRDPLSRSVYLRRNLVRMNRTRGSKLKSCADKKLHDVVEIIQFRNKEYTVYLPPHCDTSASDNQDMYEKQNLPARLFMDKLVQVKYAFTPGQAMYKCLLCPYPSLKAITLHYKTQHSDSEVLISRLSKEEADAAVADAGQHDYESCVQDMGMSLDDKRRRVKSKLSEQTYFCRMCQAGNICDVSSFFVHVSGHTGEYRFRCPHPDCSSLGTSHDNIKNHINFKHRNYKNRKELCSRIIELFPLPNVYDKLFGYLCSKCHFVQTMRRNVERHLRTYHPCDPSVNILRIDMSGRSYHEPPEPGTSHGQLNSSRVEEIGRENDDTGEVSDEPEKDISVPEVSQTEIDGRKRRSRKTEVEKLLEIHDDVGIPKDDVTDVEDKKSLSWERVKTPRGAAGTKKPTTHKQTCVKAKNTLDKGQRESRKIMQLQEALRKFRPASKVQVTGLRGALGTSDLIPEVWVGNLQASKLVNSDVLFQCEVKGCIFSSTGFDLFESHITKTHARVKWDGKCQTCCSYIKQGTHAGIMKYKLSDALHHMKFHMREGEDDVPVQVKQENPEQPELEPIPAQPDETTPPDPETTPPHPGKVVPTVEVKKEMLGSVEEPPTTDAHPDQEMPKESPAIPEIPEIPTNASPIPVDSKQFLRVRNLAGDRLSTGKFLVQPTEQCQNDSTSTLMIADVRSLSNEPEEHVAGASGIESSLMDLKTIDSIKGPPNAEVCGGVPMLIRSSDYSTASPTLQDPVTDQPQMENPGIVQCQVSGSSLPRMMVSSEEFVTDQPRQEGAVIVRPYKPPFGRLRVSSTSTLRPIAPATMGSVIVRPAAVRPETPAGRFLIVGPATVQPDTPVGRSVMVGPVAVRLETPAGRSLMAGPVAVRPETPAVMRPVSVRRPIPILSKPSGSTPQRSILIRNRRSSCDGSPTTTRPGHKPSNIIIISPPDLSSSASILIKSPAEDETNCVLPQKSGAAGTFYLNKKNNYSTLLQDTPEKVVKTYTRSSVPSERPTSGPLKTPSEVATLLTNDQTVLSSASPTSEGRPEGSKDSPSGGQPLSTSSGKNVKDKKIYQEMLMSEAKLMDLFKCMAVACSFTSNSRDVFDQHLGLHRAEDRYSKKKKKNKLVPNWQQCAYCSQVLSATLSEHIQQEHGHCLYQCNYCFYRAVCEDYVLLHQDYCHYVRPHSVIKCPALMLTTEKKEERVDKLCRKSCVRPYICAQCNEKYYITRDFLEHLTTVHKSVTTFSCHLCKNIFLRANRLVEHYMYHSFNTYQCSYCLHGAELEREMLFHQCHYHSTMLACIYLREHRPTQVRTVNSLVMITHEDPTLITKYIRPRTTTDPEQVVDEGTARDRAVLADLLGPSSTDDDVAPVNIDLSAMVTELGINVTDGPSSLLQQLSTLDPGTVLDSGDLVTSLLPNAQFSSDVPWLDEMNVPVGQLPLKMMDRSVASSHSISEIVSNLHQLDTSVSPVLSVRDKPLRCVRDKPLRCVPRLLPGVSRSKTNKVPWTVTGGETEQLAALYLPQTDQPLQAPQLPQTQVRETHQPLQQTLQLPQTQVTETHQPLQAPQLPQTEVRETHQPLQAPQLPETQVREILQPPIIRSEDIALLKPKQGSSVKSALNESTAKILKMREKTNVTTSDLLLAALLKPADTEIAGPVIPDVKQGSPAVPADQLMVEEMGVKPAAVGQAKRPTLEGLISDVVTASFQEYQAVNLTEPVAASVVVAVPQDMTPTDKEDATPPAAAAKEEEGKKIFSDDDVIVLDDEPTKQPVADCIDLADSDDDLAVVVPPAAREKRAIREEMQKLRDEMQTTDDLLEDESGDTGGRIVLARPGPLSIIMPTTPADSLLSPIEEAICSLNKKLESEQKLRNMEEQGKLNESDSDQYEIQLDDRTIRKEKKEDDDDEEVKQIEAEKQKGQREGEVGIEKLNFVETAGTAVQGKEKTDEGVEIQNVSVVESSTAVQGRKLKGTDTIESDRKRRKSEAPVRSVLTDLKSTIEVIKDTEEVGKEKLEEKEKKTEEVNEEDVDVVTLDDSTPRSSEDEANEEKQESDRSKREETTAQPSAQDVLSTRLRRLSTSGPKNELSGKALFVCGIPSCSYSSETADELKDHLLVCDLSRECSMLVCPHCPRQSRLMKTVANYMSHIVMHGQSKFECGLCGYKNATKAATGSHVKSKHKITKVNWTPKQGLAEEGYLVAFPVGHVSSSAKESGKQVMKYRPGDEDKLPLRAVYATDVHCAMCPYYTKVRSNMVRHFKMHVRAEETEGEVVVPSTAYTNPVPCLDTKEKMFDKMTNLAASSQMEKVVVQPLTTEELSQMPQMVKERERYKCCAKDCTYMTIDDSMLCNHIRALHQELASYACPHCPDSVNPDARIVPIDKIDAHLKFHDTKLYRCAYCCHFHYQKHLAEKHVMEKHADKRFYVHTVREPKGDAVTSEEGDVSRVWKCGICHEFETANRSSMMDHLHKIHSTKSKYKCSRCSLKSNTVQSFTHHFALKHPGEKVLYVKTFSRVVSQNQKPEPTPEPFDTTPLWKRDKTGARHIRGILIEEEEVKRKKGRKPPPVEEPEAEAEQTYSEMSASLAEVNCNSNANMYTCPLCKHFKTKSAENFRIHLYQELKYRQLACKLCARTFYEKKAFEKHHSKVHPDKEPSLNILKENTEITFWVDKVIDKERAEMSQRMETEHTATVSLPINKRAGSSLEGQGQPVCKKMKPTARKSTTPKATARKSTTPVWGMSHYGRKSEENFDPNKIMSMIEMGEFQVPVSVSTLYNLMNFDPVLSIKKVPD